MWWSGRNRRGLSYRVRRGRVINFDLACGLESKKKTWGFDHVWVVCAVHV